MSLSSLALLRRAHFISSAVAPWLITKSTTPLRVWRRTIWKPTTMASTTSGLLEARMWLSRTVSSAMPALRWAPLEQTLGARTRIKV
ncbi:hypothetical protein CSUB01_09063 [Colletotrichum sublineola]|uniref:Uncharacterized protein n=1 Tax=Colletotrichum sublineola TaxID=1173701 RepID=A0A066XJL8_COLSU|nr:hypothetical protein CSUB01_09063 [Colletotrichum sublineola]